MSTPKLIVFAKLISIGDRKTSNQKGTPSPVLRAVLTIFWFKEGSWKTLLQGQAIAINVAVSRGDILALNPVLCKWAQFKREKKFLFYF